MSAPMGGRAVVLLLLALLSNQALVASSVAVTSERADAVPAPPELALAREAVAREQMQLAGDRDASNAPQVDAGLMPQLVEVDSAAHANNEEEELAEADAHESAEHAHASVRTGAVPMMRREALLGEQAASLATLAGAAAGPTVWSPRRRSTSTNVVNLDGTWTTATGRQHTITGTTVTGPNNYQVDIVIKEGGRRLEMTYNGKNYWALVSGRGMINWNDGDVWTRKVDCKWGDWSEFGACGGPCGPGKQQRTRRYEYVQENGGAPCVGSMQDCFTVSFCGGASQNKTVVDDDDDDDDNTTKKNKTNSSNGSNKSAAAPRGPAALLAAPAALLLLALRAH